MRTSVALIDSRNAEKARYLVLKDSGALRSEIDSAGSLNAATALGTALAIKRMEDMEITNPTLKESADAHRLIYFDVLNQAGSPRKLGQMSGFAGRIGAESPRVPLEMEMLRLQMDEMLRESGAVVNQQAACASIAFYHARFVAIQPFSHGNEVVGRAVMAAQARQAFGESAPLLKHIEENKDQYIAAVQEAVANNDLTPLTSIVATGLGVEPPSSEVPAPYAVAPRRMFSLTDIGTIDDEMSRTKTNRPLPNFAPATSMSMS